MKQNNLAQTVRGELDAVKDDWIRQITDSVVKALGEKIDKMYVKLDKFVGDIQDKRQAQELHQGDHDQLDRRVSRVEKKLNFSPLAD